MTEQRARWKAWGLLGVQLVLITFVMFLPEGHAWSLPLTVVRVVSAVSWFGLAIVGFGLVNLGRSVSPLPTPVAHGALRTDGLFAYVRHPVYSGLFVWATASAVASGSVLIAVVALALMGWLSLKARWEEARLRERYPDYDAYAARTPRYVPFWPMSGSAGGAEGGSDAPPRG